MRLSDELIVPNLDQPPIRKIARPHFFVRVIVWRIFRINHDMPIIIRRPRVVAPNVRFSYLMIGIVGSQRQTLIVPKDLPDLENSRRRSSVAFLLSESPLVLPSEARSPSNSILAKQDRERSRHERPVPVARSLK